MRSAVDLLKPAWQTVGYNTPGSAPVPMFRAHAWALEAAHNAGARFVVSSADRREGVAEKYGKSSQAALYAAFLRGQGNPANPPGYSSHELRSDGIPFYGPRGSKIPRFKLGIDATDDGQADTSEHLRKVLASLGLPTRRPYSDGRESHHFSFIEPMGNAARGILFRQIARHHSAKWRAAVHRAAHGGKP